LADVEEFCFCVQINPETRHVAVLHITQNIVNFQDYSKKSTNPSRLSSLNGFPLFIKIKTVNNNG